LILQFIVIPKECDYKGDNFYRHFCGENGMALWTGMPVYGRMQIDYSGADAAGYGGVMSVPACYFWKRGKNDVAWS